MFNGGLVGQKQCCHRSHRPLRRQMDQARAGHRLSSALPIILAVLLAACSFAPASAAFSSQRPQIVPSIGYEVQLGIADARTQLCVLGCRQHKRLQTLIPAHIPVLMVCGECATPTNTSSAEARNSQSGGGRRGGGRKVEVSVKEVSWASGTTCSVAGVCTLGAVYCVL